MSKYKAAIIGCGRIGTHTRESLLKNAPPCTLPLNHADAIKGVNSLKLAALCDVNSENLKRASLEHDVNACYSDFKKMIRDVKPDIVSIATRTNGRCDILKDVVNDGVKGVYIEKPISNSIIECRDALNEVNINGAFIAYGVFRRYMQSFQDAKQILLNGEIGELIQISVEMGRSMLLWSHPHAIDLMLFFSNSREVEYIQGNCTLKTHLAKNARIVDEDPIVDSATVKFRNGVSGVIVSRGGGNVTLCGTLGTITIVADGSWIKVEKKVGDSPYFSGVDKRTANAKMSGTQRAFYELSRAIETSSPISITTDEILISQQILIGIAFSSLQNGIRMPLVSIPEHFTVTGRYGDLYA